MAEKETEMNKDGAAANGARQNAHNRRYRHRGNRQRGGENGAVRRPEAAENGEERANAAENVRAGAQTGGSSPERAGNERGRNAQRPRGGRGGQRPDRKPERDESTTAPNANGGGAESAFGVSPFADKTLDDTFAPLHEKAEIHDPAAEAEAKRILDSEGPLLFREQSAKDASDADGKTNDQPAETTEIVGVRFKAQGKVYYFDPGELKLAQGSYAIVETTRGAEYGEVYIGNTRVPTADLVLPLRPVVRAATEEDARHNEENHAKEESAFAVCRDKIAAHGLDMKLVDAQYTFDNSKLLFYFTPDGRVDFRELVKDLAGVFRTRIELRQIGIRDEAKLLGGLGTCGRPLCCAGFLTDFGQVSIKMAKEQNLSLNSTKISGCCGRLMCCLRYEYETYEQEIRLTPPVDAEVETPDGRGTVISNNPLRGTVTVRFPEETEGRGSEVKVYLRDNVRVIGGKRRAEPVAEENEQKE